ncbi:MAG: UDP-3-O-(3-hydroxymyristoyl)glucosamine N-acyltransferase [Geobacteraceae bacterium]
MGKSLKELAAYLNGRVIGDPGTSVVGIGSLDEAIEGEITFLGNPRYADKLLTTRATAVVLPPGADNRGINAIEVASPYLAFAKLLTLFHVRPPKPGGIMAGAWVGKDVTIGSDVTIYPGAFVADGVRLGERATLFPGVVLYEGVELGDDVTLHANVCIRERCRIGNRVVIHNGAVVGGDGFGYAPDGAQWYKIPQIGIVLIEDDVEIGANTTIDRAALDVTLVKRGTKIDNLVQIAHNCVIGENCMIISQTGIAGSCTLGDNVTIGGNVAIVGHVRLGDNVMVGGMSGVAHNVPAGQSVSGIPAFPHKEWLKASIVLPRLPEMQKTLKALEKRIAELEEKLVAR